LTQQARQAEHPADQATRTIRLIRLQAGDPSFPHVRHEHLLERQRPTPAQDVRACDLDRCVRTVCGLERVEDPEPKVSIVPNDQRRPSPIWGHPTIRVTG
jgi:hypothetical protein